MCQVVRRRGRLEWTRVPFYACDVRTLNHDLPTESPPDPINTHHGGGLIVEGEREDVLELWCVVDAGHERLAQPPDQLGALDDQAVLRVRHQLWSVRTVNTSKSSDHSVEGVSHSGVSSAQHPSVLAVEWACCSR
jgi:hypothetical protein